MKQKTIGIIAEWNPFHRGHEAMVQEVRARFDDAFIMAVMSSPFVQRGEPALFDSWTRARWAAEGGIDAVFALPVLYALQSADHFAAFGVKLLAAMGAEVISFGTESLDEDALWEAASFSFTHTNKGNAFAPKSRLDIIKVKIDNSRKQNPIGHGFNGITKNLIGSLKRSSDGHFSVVEPKLIIGNDNQGIHCFFQSFDTFQCDLFPTRTFKSERTCDNS